MGIEWKKEEGQSSLVGAYAYGIALTFGAVGAIWFSKFFSNLYDQLFPREIK